MQRSFTTRLVSFVSLITIALTAAALPAACGSDETEDATGTPGCDGVLIDGVCEPKCDPVKCLEGLDAGVSANSCVNNICALECTSHQDCFNFNNGANFPAPGQGYLQHTQDCTADVADDNNVPKQVCQSNAKARGFGYACPFGNECTDWHKLYSCPNGAPCNGPNAPSCEFIDADQNGSDDNTCQKDPALCRGNPECVTGRCNISKAPCSLVDQCAPELCQPLGCLTTGQGDADAYCTRFDCQQDADCPGGFYCGLTRVPQDICGKEETKGPSAWTFCGTDGPVGDCVDPANFTANGATFVEGATCLFRKACLKRDPCVPCESNLDCSVVANMRCGRQANDGVQVCGQLCNPAVGDDDCEADYRCDPNGLVQPEGGPAGALGVCVHRYGQCKGNGGFCEPCLSDLDCAEGVTCFTATGHEKICFELPISETCPSGSDNDCPQAPNGTHGTCFNEGEDVFPGDNAYELCYLPIEASTFKTGCWY